MISRRSVLKGRAASLFLPMGSYASEVAEASDKSLIIVFLKGGPSSIDMFDMKPAAPAEIRGEFSPIATNVAGMDVCELLPGLAGIADKLSLVRSLHGFQNDHNTHWC